MRQEMITTSERGLRTDSLPYRLFQKAKKFGVWDPRDIDFTQDIEDWKTLSSEQQHQTLRLIAQFQAGEESVTLDILPLLLTVAREGRLEEEMYLTTFLFEEAKHTEFFRLVLNAIGHTEDLSHLLTPTYRKIFCEILPETMHRLLEDTSPEAIAEAATVYNMFVEGVLAETGYWSFFEGLNKQGKMPGLMKGISYLKTDESRHIGYGTFLLQRLICEHPHLFDFVQKKLMELAPLSMALNQEGYQGQDQSAFTVPFEETMQFSLKQLNVRLEVLARAKDQTLDEIYRLSESAVGIS